MKNITNYRILDVFAIICNIACLIVSLYTDDVNSIKCLILGVMFLIWSKWAADKVKEEEKKGDIS